MRIRPYKYTNMKRTIRAIFWLLCLLPTWLPAQNNGVQISPSGGVYAEPFPVTLTCDNPDLTIRYTLNGTVPNGRSPLYSEPLMLNNSLKSRSDIYKIPISPKSEFHLPDSVIKGIVIRAATFDSKGNRVSPVVTQSYFIGTLGCNVHGLPVVSICADSLSLFARDTGILVPGKLFNPNHADLPGNYSQHGREWERTVNVEFYDTGNEGFNQTAGMRTHGGVSARRAQQKGLKLYARKEYGQKNFRYRIFEGSELEKYKHLVLRPFRNAAKPTGVNDWLANQIAAPLNMGSTASRPVILFLNGEYWGLYFIEEKADEHYLESHYDVDHNDVNIVAHWCMQECGSSEGFMSLFHWLEKADLSDSAQYRLASQQIDIPNFIDYYLFELYSANWDWPGNNVRCWQSQKGPWRWVFYDGDCCLDDPDYEAYLIATITGEYWSSGGSATLFFRKLLESPTFKNQFLLRLEQLNKTVFSYPLTKPYFDKIHQLLKDEIPNQMHRFGIPESVAQWEESNRKLDHFLSVRVERLWQQTVDFFHLRNDKVLSVACNRNRTSSGKGLMLTITTEESCTALMEIHDSKGRIIHHEYLFLQQGNNQMPLKLGKRWGTYVIKVGDVTCAVTKISYTILIIIFIVVLAVIASIFLKIRRKKASLLLLCLLLPSWLLAQNNEVQVSPKGGAYPSAFPVTLTCGNPALQIRYTLNGAVPDGSSALYSEPLMLSNSLKSHSDIYKIPIVPESEFYLPDSVIKGIVIRAAAFDSNGNRVTPVTTQSYFISALGCDVHGLPIVSICADSLSLFAHDTGIMVPGAYFDPQDSLWTGNYYQEGRDWERLCNVEYYTMENEIGFNQQAGLRTHGGNGRRLDQKGLKIYAREEYGKKRFKYKIFDDLDIDNFKHLILKPFKSSWTEAGLQNYLSYFLAKDLNLDVLATRPVVLFLNGEYWGIYFIQEKADERYLENHYGIDPDSPDIIGSWLGQIEEGSDTYFYELMAYVESADLSDENEYQHLASIIDIDNFIDYQILEIFTSNYDWPANNMRCWQTEGYPWRWFFFDCDACFGDPYYDYYRTATDTSDSYWPTNATSTLLFRALLRNETFEQKFIARLKSLIRHNLAYKNTKPYLVSAMSQVQNEITHQVGRFQFPKSIEEWEKECRYIDRFLRDRETEIAVQTDNYFHIYDGISSISCFPNPVKGERMCIRLISEQAGPETVRIYDMKGQCVYSEQREMTIGWMMMYISPNLNPGVYVLTVGQKSVKIVVI